MQNRNIWLVIAAFFLMAYVTLSAGLVETINMHLLLNPSLYDPNWELKLEFFGQGLAVAAPLVIGIIILLHYGLYHAVKEGEGDFITLAAIVALLAFSNYAFGSRGLFLLQEQTQYQFMHWIGSTFSMMWITYFFAALPLILTVTALVTRRHKSATETSLA